MINDEMNKIQWKSTLKGALLWKKRKIHAQYCYHARVCLSRGFWS